MKNEKYKLKVVGARGGSTVFDPEAQTRRELVEVARPWNVRREYKER